MIRAVRVLAPNPGPFTLEGTNTWIVGAAPSMVIDPGPDDPRHIAAVLEAGGPVAAILLTHAHPDHAPGAAPLAAATGAPVLAFDPEPGQRRLTDGEVIQFGGAALRAVHTPGHSPDHVAFFADDEEMLFTGDAVLGRGTSVVNPPEGDMAAYLRSLRRMLDLSPRAIYPGHGPVVFEARARLEQYLAHRAARERQVLASLAAGRSRPGEMVPEIYGDTVPPSLFPAASRSVLAHLLKLEREGRVVRTGPARDERFALVEPKECRRCGGTAIPGSRYCRRCGLELLQEGPAPGGAPEPRD